MQYRTRNWHWPYKFLSKAPFIPSKKNKLLQRHIMSMAALLAKADGRICENEIRVVTELIDDELEYTEKVRNQAIHVFNEAKKSNTPLQFHAERLYQEFGNSKDILGDSLDFLLELAYSDSKFCENESRLIYSAIRALDITESELRSLQSVYHQSLVSKETPVVQGYKSYRERKPTRSGFSTAEVFNSEIRELYSRVDSFPSDSIESITEKYNEIKRQAEPDFLTVNASKPQVIEKAKKKLELATEAYEKIVKFRSGKA